MTYIITYNLILDFSCENGKIIKVHNKSNELFAKCALEDYLRRKYNTFKRLEITECKLDTDSSLFDLFGLWKFNYQ